MAPTLTREEKFEIALDELEGFAERNVRRAQVALAVAKEDFRIYGLDHHRLGVTIEEVRLHEAERFFLVIHERVKEAKR